MENAEKKGMSKGCVVALVIGGIAILLIAIAVGACWVFKDDLLKAGGKTALTAIKTEIAENPVEGVDTTQFNSLVDAFIEKIEASEHFELETFGLFMSKIGNIMDDKKIDLNEVEDISDAMVKYFPDLDSLIITPSEEDELPVDDSAEVNNDSNVTGTE